MWAIVGIFLVAAAFGLGFIVIDLWCIFHGHGSIFSPPTGLAGMPAEPQDSSHEKA